MALPEGADFDRRLHLRYPVEIPLEYTAILGSGEMITGSARVIDLSTGGLLFEGCSCLPVGLTIQMSIVWPRRCGSTIGLKLHAIGMTVRSEGNFTAVRIQEHEFRPSQDAVREQPEDAQFAPG